VEYLVVVEKGEAGFGAYVPDLPGCVKPANRYHHPSPGAKSSKCGPPEFRNAYRSTLFRDLSAFRIRANVGLRRIIPTSSSLVVPSARSDLSSKLTETPGPPASILAILDWLEPIV